MVLDLGDEKFAAIDKYTDDEYKDPSIERLATKKEFLDEILSFTKDKINDGQLPRLQINTGKPNRYGDMWEYIDWSPVSWSDVWSAIGSYQEFPGFSRLVFDGFVYVFYWDGPSDDAAFCYEKMNKSEYNSRYVLE